MGHSKIVALATDASRPQGNEDDAALVHGLRSLGYQVAFPVWSDPQVQWKSFGAVVPRSTWDYYDRIIEFKKWIHFCSENSVKLMNSPDLILNNLDKIYLKELAVIGIPTLPTRWENPNSQADFFKIFENLENQEWILKPSISAGADLTLRWKHGRDPDGKKEEWISEWLAKKSPSSTLMIQPFLPEILEHGEWSLIYFDGKYQHTSHKVPKQGDFRVQPMFGSAINSEDPSKTQLQVAEKILASLPETPLYARIDLVGTKDQPRLIELELIEPHLYFGFAPRESADFLARAIHERTRS